MALQPILVQSALRLQFPPFTWLFKAYYGLAILLSRWLVGGVDGVQSIYLSGSLARKGSIYGLSDIDFKVFVSGARNPSIYQSIRRRFHSLRRIFPMLGSPDEKGIYFLDSFASDYSHYPLVQHLFDDRYFSHKLIFGEDVIPTLPIKPWNKLDQGECIFGRLKDWIEKIHLLADSDVLCRPQKQHLFFKAACDIGLMTIRIRKPDFGCSRRSDILRQLLPELTDSDRRLVENLIEENRLLYRNKLNGDAENFWLFKRMIALCCQKAACENGIASSPTNITLPSPYCASADSSIESNLQSFSAKIQKVSGIHWPQLPLNPLDLDLSHAPAYLVFCREFLDLAEFHELKAFYRNNLKGKAGVFLFENSNFLSSVDSDLVDHWGGFPQSSDLLYRFLGSEPRETLSILERERIETRAGSFLEQLAAILASPDFGRMDLSVFPLFLFNALRVLIFNYELSRGKWQWSITPDQTVEYCIGHTPLSPDFVGKLAREYENRTSGVAHFDEALMPKCRVLLSRMLEISRNGRSWAPLEELNSMPDKYHLFISAAVITANRPHQLKRCLDSLSCLSRLPEELIVVDSGRDPLTRSIVEQYRAGFPIQYVHSEPRGVAGARNMAARIAKGEVIAFLDDDASVDPEWLEQLERVFLRDPQIGLAGGAILNMACGRNDLVWRFMEAVEKI
jgi:hypothetical protein